MTLSPSRSFKNFADSPMNRPVAKWAPLSWSTLKSVLPVGFVLLLGASVYLYAKIFSQASLGTTEPTTVDIASSAAYFSKLWLQTQVKQLTSEAIDFHPGIPANTISSVDPFSLSTGINVWDLYSPQLSCPDVVRVGKIGEGGKWVCGLSQLAHDNACVMYSFGISTDISFEVEILRRTNCIIHAFDPTVGALPIHNLNDMTPQQRSRIHFHKTALGIHSGTSEMHSLNEQLLDIMHRLEHTFINLLKIDIEGGEWAVFNSLFINGVYKGQRHSERTSEPVEVLPVGQLLIELHYNTMEDTEAFFAGAARNGLLPYSREINLQPCVSGGMPVAVEYSFIHVDHYYNGANIFKTVPAAHTPEWHKPIKGVIYYLTQRSRVERLSKALRSLYENFCRDYPSYPVLIFHDDLRASDERALLVAVPLLQMKFVKITLSTPVELIQSGLHIPERTTCAPDSSTLGYRHMCRFHATGIHQHLEELGYGQYEYVMRMDDDGLINSPVGYDLFRYMKVNEKQYGFVNMVADDPACVVDLWEKSEVFFNATSFPTKEASLFLQWPRGVVYYNNFEISALKLWKDRTWRAYMAYIDTTAGIYTQRWGDAPLHTIGVSMLVARSQIHAFTDIAYHHSPFADQVPKGLPMPKMDPFVGPEVECRYYDQWRCYKVHASQNFTMNSTTNGSSVAAFMTNFSTSSLRDSLSHMLLLHYDAAATVGAEKSQHPVALSGEAGQAALFSFGHGGREIVLAATLQSFYDNYLAFHPTPIIIFYSDRGAFDVSIMQQQLALSAVLPLVSFKPVALTSVEDFQSHSSCVPRSAEIRATTFFFRYEATKMLKSLGFSWIFRFGDDSRLNKPVRFNIFEYMHREGKKFAYLGQVDDRPECIHDLHSLVHSLCGAHGTNLTVSTTGKHQRNLRASARRTKQENNLSAPRGLSSATAVTTAASHALPCAQLPFWREGRIFLTNFEVSHVGVWEAPICQQLFSATGQALRDGATVPLWGDAALHTYCVLMSLDENDIVRLNDVDYRFNWTTATHIRMQDARDRSAKYKSAPIVAFNEAFLPQRIGWLGGDVAASVALPNELDVRLPPNKLLFLFGDSIVGVSTKDRRIQEYSTMVSNTVGVVSLEAQKIPPCDAPAESALPERTIAHTAHFYGTDTAGAAQPLFTLPPHGNCLPHDQRVWPVAGITALPTTSTTNASASEGTSLTLLLLAQVVCLRGMSAEQLLFDEYEMALIVVHNPLDPPSMWRYSHKLFPNPAGGNLKWITFSDSKGAAFAQSGQDLYLLGGYKSSVPLSVGHQVLGKISAEQLVLMDFSSLQVLKSAPNSPSEAAVWSPAYSSTAALTPHRLFGPLVSEASMHLDTNTQEWMVVSLLPMQSNVELCRTSNIFGPVQRPWNCTLVSKVEEKWANRPELFSYAGKAHPHLLPATTTCIDRQQQLRHTAPAGASRKPLDLIVSYVSNVVETTDTDSHTLYSPEFKETYLPKFVRISSSIG